MKRPFPLLLAAFAGMVGLPVVMVACGALASHLSPAFVGAYPLGFAVFAVSTAGHIALLSGFVFAICSTILWRGERTFWPRLGAIASSVILGSLPVYMMAHEYRIMGTSMRAMYLQEVAFVFPWPLWALALFFFAVLARPRKAASTLP